MRGGRKEERRGGGNTKVTKRCKEVRMTVEGRGGEMAKGRTKRKGRKLTGQ